MLEIKQLTRLQIIRYCEKLEKENKKLKENIAWYEKEEDRLTKEISSYVNKNYILYRNCEDLNNENKFLRKGNIKLEDELERYKKQYKHTMGGDYIDEDLYDLDC